MHTIREGCNDTFRENVPTDLGSTNRPLCYPLVALSVGMNSGYEQMRHNTCRVLLIVSTWERQFQGMET